jgi:hypothetical protein
MLGFVKLRFTLGLGNLTALGATHFKRLETFCQKPSAEAPQPHLTGQRLWECRGVCAVAA